MKLTPKEWRLIREISLQGMADKLGIDYRTYKKLEDEPSNFSIIQADNFAKIVGITVDDIIFMP